MGTFNGNTQGGRFAARGAGGGKKRQAGAWLQILVSLGLLLDLFLLYTIIMQLTHSQKAIELSPTVNYSCLALFSLCALGLGYAVIRTKAWKRTLCLTLICAVLYLVVAFSQLPLVKKYRQIWIDTAMSTMRHQGLATYYFPASVVDERVNVVKKGQEDQVGVNTEDNFEHDANEHVWILDPGNKDELLVPDRHFEKLNTEQKAFYTLFYELDVQSTEDWFKAHPEALADGYEGVLVNESSLDSEGTTIRTKLGEKVLAIDRKNEILLLEVDCDGSRGVLAIAKQVSRLHLVAATTRPAYGQTAGTIAKNSGGILALTGSGFVDEGGVGNGGQQTGWSMCQGVEYGKPYGWGYKRLELHENGWFYITDAISKPGAGTTDAMEFTPALITNGNKLDPGVWTSQNPRACIGQSERGEVLMLAVEGRTVASPGCSVEVCAEMLLRHDCITALNCDGGTTAIMWYRGEPIIRCSNSAIPEGRHLPNAWVYFGE